MNKPTQSDSILAASYVDGELSSSEVGAVEERISSDAEFAAIVSMLREQSDAFRMLPKFEPSGDLAERTLQTSVDQVKAIMGHWPVEDTQPADEIAAASTHRGANWKSIASLALALAGVLVLALTLWPGTIGGPGEDYAVASRAGSEPMVAGEASTQKMSELANDDESDIAIDKLGELESAPMSKGAPPEIAMAARQPAPDAPMSDARKHESGSLVDADAEEMADASPRVKSFSGAPAPLARQTKQNPLPAVEQIWMVNPDVTAEAVGKTLASNRIAIAGSSSAPGGGAGIGGVAKQAIGQASENSVEAFYIAATPGQMKKALVELSESADIALFEMPGSQAGSQIADSIETQFKAQSAQDDPVDRNVSKLPERIVPPQNGALAQQLVARNLPRRLPSMPVPPILSPDQDAAIAKSMEAAPQTRSKVAPAKPAIAAAAARPTKSDLAADSNSTAKVDTGKQPMTHFDQYFDAADEQLRTYLILVRGDTAKPMFDSSTIDSSTIEAESAESESP